MGEDLLATHFKEGIEAGKVGRVEILPISWHKVRASRILLSTRSATDQFKYS